MVLTAGQVNTERYKHRNVVERFFNRLKQWRALATRYTKRAHYFRNEITIAAIFTWLNDPREAAYAARAAQAVIIPMRSISCPADRAGDCDDRSGAVSSRGCDKVVIGVSAGILGRCRLKTAGRERARQWADAVPAG